MRAARTNKIDGILLSSPDRKWTISRIEQIKRKFKKVNKEIIVIASDSSQPARIEKGYLPGGTISILMGRLVRLKLNGYKKKDELGR